MNKVTTINLNGKAYQLEEKGYADLHSYLEQAAKELGANPDKKEILSDLEQAIADKCDRFLAGKKDVVSTEEVSSILAEMGPVQSDQTEQPDEDPAAATKESSPRRLYIIPKGSMIVGVCNGLAAYLGLDVTIVRVLFIILAFATGGFWVFLYLILAFVLPYAKTDEQLAEAYGRRVTAQEIVDGARDRAKDLEPALSRVGQIIGKLIRICFGIAAVAAALLLGLLTTGWLVTLGWLITGNLHLTAQLSSISVWLVAADVTALYFLIALPLFVISRAGQRIARQQPVSSLNRTANRLGFVLWFVALGVMVAATGSMAGNVRDYVVTHKGYLDINGSHICVDTARAHCDEQDDNPRKLPIGPPEPIYNLPR